MLLVRMSIGHKVTKHSLIAHYIHHGHNKNTVKRHLQGSKYHNNVK